MLKATVVRGESIDPEYKIKFSFASEKFNIQDGIAFFIRKAPSAVIYFDDYTDYVVEKSGADEKDVEYIKLEIGKTVCDYLVSSIQFDLL